jgi:small basic protein (TIGR04137 family)
MSLDRSLRGKSGLERHRNVLRRSERVVTLEDQEKWNEGKNSVFGLVKVAHRKQVAAKKAPKVEAGAEGAVAAVPGAAPAAGAAAPAATAAKAAAAPAAKSPAKK